MEKIDTMENYELYISIIKRINERILKSNFALGKETETTLFLKDMKARLLRMVMNSDRINFGITSSWNENDSAQRCCLFTEVMELNDNLEQVFIAIDIDTGKICLKDDSGYPIPSAIIDGKIITSDFKINYEYDMDFIIKHVEMPNVSIEEINYYQIFDYLRNNQKAFAEFIETTHHTR